MSSINQIASDLYKVMSESDERAVKPYDVKAEVLRQEGEIVWVKIPGGVDETPVQKTNNANPGDNVMVRIAGGRAWLLGNETSPATDDTVANAATQLAEGAGTLADLASQAANDAQVSAQIAYNYADQAKQGADRAGEQAQIATGYASDAKASAIAANIASNSALTQLSVVEDVASVLTWISEHGTYKLSDDTAVVSGKLYFTRSGIDPDYEYSLITEPTGNPHTSNYYEIDTLGDETVSNYISSHLSLTNAGLWIVNDNNSYKILLAGGENAGMHVYDNYGNLVVSYGESIEFSNNKEFHIGNQNAYIIFNPANDGSITIGGSNVNIGSGKTLEQVIDELDNTFVFDTTYTVTGTDPNKVAHFEAHVYRGGVDIKSQFAESQFTWYLKTENGEEPIIDSVTGLNTGYTIDVNIADCGYGAEVIAHFTTSEDSPLLSSNNDNLTDVNNDNLLARTASGDSVRVRDLTVSTTLNATDKLMVVGIEDEHLITMQTLQDYLNVNLNKQVLFNTTAAWDAQVLLQSQADMLYIYTDHQIDSQGNLIAGIKVGDGNAYLIDMPFTDAVIMEHINDDVRHITAEERTFWNNKVSCYLADTDRIIFTTA